MRPLWTAALLLAAAPAGYAQTFTTSRVAGSGDTPPGYSTPFPAVGNFFNGFPSAHSDGTVVFNAPVPTVPEEVNIFTGTGGPLTRAVAYGSPIPSGGGTTFQTLGQTPILNASGIVFQGSSDTTATPAVQGIYRSSGGTVTVLADKTTTAPGVGTVFTSFNAAQLMGTSGSNVAFRGTTAAGNGLYASVGGSLALVADLTTGTTIPQGTGQFTTLTNVALSGTTAAFRGSGTGQQGIYLRDVSAAGNPLVRVTDRTQVLPGTGSTLVTNMNEPAISGNDVYVSVNGGAGTAKLARYAWNGSSSSPAFTPSVLAAAGDIAPGQAAATFSAFQGSVSADGGLVAFQGTFAGGTGIYLHDGTTLHRVIDSTQLLDGKPIGSFLFGPDALSGSQITFHVTFADGANSATSTRGIYVAQFTPVPEPGSALLAAAAGLTGLAAVRRRRAA